jgi:2'-5' RNA ligase
MTRAFVALLIDDAVRASVDAEIERLRPSSRAVAWVPAANLHVTLHFLGEQTDARLADATAALADAAGAARPFTLAFHGLGGFPGLERPRILWIGVAEGAIEARAVQARLETALAERGFPPDDRPWHPHLTIGRVFDERRWRRDAPALRPAIAAAARRPFGAVTVSHVSLMRSDVSSRGARYRELERAALGGS